MLSSERRGSSARRGMTVLGKIPTAPKPINLPSQRLENRGLDPNVEIVPRGSVSWGAAGRSPPTSSNAWGSLAQASSPPSSSAAWGPKAGAVSTGRSGASGGATSAGPGNIPRPSSGGSGVRPSSGGPGTRPLSAESVGQAQQSVDAFSGNSSSGGAWGARPSSASGVLGQAQPQLAQAQARPRSADIARPNRSLSEFGGEQPGNQAVAGNAAWGSQGPPRRLGEEPHQVSRFQLTRTDFPTLGSEKNPDLRPQQSNAVADRGAAAEAKGQLGEERGPPAAGGVHGEGAAAGAGGGHGPAERGAAESWRREAAAFQGPPPAAEGNWHREGPSARPGYGGQAGQAESWRREAGPAGGPADDNWRRGGGPSVGQYGPPPGPGHYPHEGPGFMHPPRFGPGPGGFGRGAAGPGGYGHHGDMYGNAGPLLRPGGPMHAMRANMFQGPVPFDGYYGPPPGAGYQGMEDPERMMIGMGGGPYGGGYAQHRGPPPEAFGRFAHGGMHQGPRHPASGNVRERVERVEAAGGDGYQDGQGFHKEGPDGPGAGHREGRGYGERYGSRESGEGRRGAPDRGAGGDVHGHGQRGVAGGHRDWGAAASSDEPMDFSKPVFEEEAASASPNGAGRESPAGGRREERPTGQGRREEAGADADEEKSVVETESPKEEEKQVVVAAKKEEKKEVVTAKKEAVAMERSAEATLGPKYGEEDGVAGGEAAEAKEQGERRAGAAVEKEAVARIVKKDGPGKWERGSKRGERQAREVIGPAAGNAPAAAGARAGQVTSVTGPAKASILGNAPRSGSGESQGGSEEKASGATSSEGEGAAGAERGRTWRRPESLKVEGGGVESGAPEASAVQTGTAQGSGGKEGPKAKGKAASHDGEKEWRPKVAIAEASPRGGAAGAAKAGVSSSSSGAEAPEESSAELEDGLKPGSYDYDAQRAKMREIAAQRARQLQKEEEERIKEQKAKARAKLEELDRRATAVPAGGGEEADAEAANASGEAEEGGQAEEGPVAEPEPEAVVQSGGGTKRGVRNEHSKRERDRKVNGRKAGAGEAAKVKANGSNGQGSGVAAPLASSGGAPLTTSVVGAGAQEAEASAAREPRQRGRGEKKQVVAKSERGGAAAESAAWGATGGWSMDAPLPQQADPATASHWAASGTEASGGVRKNKNSRSGRSRQRSEATAVMAESIQFGDLVSGLHIPAFQSMMGGEQVGDAGSAALQAEAGKEGNVSASGDALTGDEGSAVSTNGDASGKRSQRKSRGGGRRGPGRSDRGSQEQRAGEKAHSGEGMVWAPVRSPKGEGGIKWEGGQSGEQAQKEERSSAQQQARAKRAEMERYTPKPLMKQQESWDQGAGAPGQGQGQGAHGPSWQVGGSAAERPRALSAAEGKQVGSGEAKSNNEAKGSESGTKGGKSHGSWRQRGLGSERAAEGAKEAAGGAHVSGAGHGDSGHPRPRAEQKGGVGQGASRRNQAASDHVAGAAGVGPSASAPDAGATAVMAPAPAPATAPAPSAASAASAGAGSGSVQASERDHPADKKLYQPPRPGPPGGQRGQDHRVQDYRGQGNRGQEHRGQDFRGQDFRGQEHRGQDQRGQGAQGSEQKGHEQSSEPHSRHQNAQSEVAGAGENVGSQQAHQHPHAHQHQHQHQHRNGGGQHARGQNAEREQASSQQALMYPQSQQRAHPGVATGSKEASHPASRERETHQQQQQAGRGSVQHAAEGGEAGSNHRGGRSEAARAASGAQRGQGHWQQTGSGEGHRSGASRGHPTEREAGQYGRTEASKQQAAEAHRVQQAEQAGQEQQRRASQQTGPGGTGSRKAEGGSWEGAGDGAAASRGRDYSHGRRGRFGGRSGPRNVETESRREAPSSKQRLVINATRGAVPSQVAG